MYVNSTSANHVANLMIFRRECRADERLRFYSRGTAMSISEKDVIITITVQR